jgi:hypothetical protein
LAAILSAAKKAEALRSVSFKKEYIWLILIGIVLPLVALSVELALRICASHSFDPFPSNAHALMFALIPISNLLILLCVASDLSEHYAFLTLLNGMASGIALTYALMFLPLMPVSLMFVFLLGFGLLGLAPLLAFVSTMRAGKIICDLAHSHHIYFEPEHTKHLGHLLIIASVVAIELPSTLTRIHLDMAAQPAEAHEGIDWLRKYGNQEVMLRACYERSGRATDILGSLYEAAHPLDVAKAREIFYTVTGKPFNSVPIPMAARATMQHAGVTIDGKSVEDEFDVDTDIAGESVSSISRGLSLTSSEIVGDAVPTLSLARLAWTIELQNISKYKREGRAKVALPPGSVVTGATLWLDGRRLSATISARKIARQVYRGSLVKEDHPLLVSTCGPDQILVQCYPIKPYSIVKIELTIVAPFQLRSFQEGAIVLPSLSEQNFGLTSQPISKFALGHVIENGKIWTCPVTAGLGQYRVEQTVGGINFVATQELTQADRWIPGKMIVILDGSASMAPFFPEVLKALESLPSGLPSKLVFVSDHIVSDFSTSGTPDFKSDLAQIASALCVGGQDDSAQLVMALYDSIQTADTAVLWIHGSQPLGTSVQAKVRALLCARSEHPFLYDLQVSPGPEEVLNGISFAPGLEKVQRFGSVGSDLQNLFSHWVQRSKILLYNRTCAREYSNMPLRNVRAYDEDIASLAANDRILTEGGGDVSLVSDDSYLLASDLHLVTPISSAIVSTHRSIRERAAPGLMLSARQSLRMIQKSPSDLMAAVNGQLNSLSSAGGSATGPSDAQYSQSNGAAAPSPGGFDAGAVLSDWGAAAKKELSEDDEIGKDAAQQQARPSLKGYEDGALSAVEEEKLEYANKDQDLSGSGSIPSLSAPRIDRFKLPEIVGPLLAQKASVEPGEKPLPWPGIILMILASLCLAAFIIFQKWRDHAQR